MGQEEHCDFTHYKIIPIGEVFTVFSYFIGGYDFA